MVQSFTMQKGKMVLKQCPKCEQQECIPPYIWSMVRPLCTNRFCTIQCSNLILARYFVPVACKACPCGHIYFHARKPGGGTKAAAGSSESGVVNAVKRRRLEQVNQARTTRGSLRSTSKPHRSHRSSTSTSNAEESDRLIEDHPKKRRARPKPSEKEEKIEQPEEDVFASVPPENSLLYSIALAEINRKLGMSQNLQI